MFKRAKAPILIILFAELKDGLSHCQALTQIVQIETPAHTKYIAVECPISEENLASMSNNGGLLTELESQYSYK